MSAQTAPSRITHTDQWGGYIAPFDGSLLQFDDSVQRAEFVDVFREAMAGRRVSRIGRGALAVEADADEIRLVCLDAGWPLLLCMPAKEVR